MRLRSLLIGFAVAACLSGAALAQAPQTTRLRGIITAVEGHAITVKSRDGESRRVVLAEGFRLVSPKRVKLSDIKPGSFIGTAAVPGPGGTLKALEVVVFPEDLRGTGEGHYAWDLTPESSMTNATVDAAVQATDGRELKLSYKGGSVTVVVPEEAPIVTPVPAEESDLKPGAAVFLAASKGADGTLTALRAWVAKDGIDPPM